MCTLKLIMALLNVWCYAGPSLQHSMVRMGNFLKHLVILLSLLETNKP